MLMGFRRWMESGASAGLGGVITASAGVPGGVAPAIQDYHGKEGSDSENPEGALPPVKKISAPINKKYARRKRTF
jgi:hypothetical protein